MTCAMRLHDPCAGEVSRHRLLRGVHVPLCEKHVDAWDTRTVPFANQSEERRQEWARLAAERAVRQHSMVQNAAGDAGQ
jgi:hypothetical protein